MTETEWLACTDPQRMLRFLRGKASGRKLGLFALACSKRMRDRLLGDRRPRMAGGAESSADRYATETQVEAAPEAANALVDDTFAERLDGNDPGRLAVAVWVAVTNPWYFSPRALAGIAVLVVSDQGAEIRAQKEHLTDLAGPLPFRPVSLAPTWLAWNEGTVKKIAQRIDDERAFDHLPALANALREAGCDNEDVLTHCRSPRPHGRGCWVIDLILGKE